MSALITEAQLADDFGISREKAAELRRKRKWPHVKLGRFEVRYTQAQVAAIVAMQTATPEKSTPVEPVIAGQTARSRRRSA